ncbi:MAG: DUF192 domain-containing protein [Pseudomonas oryzihabitans]
MVAVLTVLTGMPAGAGERVELRIGERVLRVEIAATPAQRTLGLMGRAPLREDEGMLFVFPGDDIRCLWMRDTPSALAAAFITANGVILNLAEMQPQTDTRHCSRAPARYALETATGWFSQRSIAAGAKIQGLDAVPPALR